MIFLAASVIYIVNMANRGYRPLQPLFLIIPLVGGFMIFGLYYGGLWLKLIQPGEPNRALMILNIIGAALLLLDLVLLIAKKTLRAIPLWILFVLFSYIFSVLTVAVVQAVILLIAIIVMIFIFGSGGRKKIIRGDDGKLYKEI